MTEIAPSVLSAHERAMAQGCKTLQGGVSERIVRLLDAVRSYGPPRVEQVIS